MSGPFEVRPEAVERLGQAFAPLVNDLLTAEVGKAGMFGYQLQINQQYNTADGGVDAALHSSVQTDWLPGGDSVWQFKSSDLEPQACRDELRGAEWALHRMRDGATYVLVIGRPLTDEKRDRRLEALCDEAESLNLDRTKVRLYDGNQLARWISSFPARSLDRRLGGPGPVLLDFERWSNAASHQGKWVPCSSRAEVVDAVLRVAAGELPAYRIEGESGLGKTRLVMEALRPMPLRSLVVYAPLADHVTPETLAYLVERDGSALLVVDNCSRAQHQAILEQLDLRTVKVITIGDDSRERLIQTPFNDLPPASTDEVEAILVENAIGIWPEAIRVVTSNCFGNVRTALLLAERLVSSGEVAVASLLQQDDFRAIITALLPEDVDFFSAAILALLERVGWDRDRRYQLETLASFAGLDLDHLEGVARRLESAGLLGREGRYRSIAPHPVSVLLAADAWAQYGGRIVDELIPSLDAEMTRALYQRCADLGRYEPARDVLNRLLRADGQFGSLQLMEEQGTSGFLTQLAIVMPDRTARHLSELIEAESLDTLSSQTSSRRGLVNALEKLIWHPETFALAADSMLKLALAENETWANNASGLWVSIFGARLPSTAASPEARADYLRRTASDERASVRKLAAKAAGRALSPREWTSVSGELQGGAVVAPRGTAQAGDQVVAYLSAMVRVLDTLASDQDHEVRALAEEGLVSSLRSFLTVREVGDLLAASVTRFRGESLTTLRRALEGIVRHARDHPVVEAVHRLEQQLPVQDSKQRLRELLTLNPWDWQLQRDKSAALDELVDAAIAEGWIDGFLAALREEPLPGAWHLGQALGARSADSLPPQVLVDSVATNAPALAGFLRARVELGDTSAFDDFFAQLDDGNMQPATQLYVTVAGPASDVARQRAIALGRTLPTAEVAGRLLVWQENLTDAEIESLLSDWCSTVTDDRTYAVLIDWIAMLAHRERALPDSSMRLVLAFLADRVNYPDIGNERWDWCEVAMLFVALDPLRIAQIVLDLVSLGELVMLGSDREAEVLRSCAAAAPQEVWFEVSRRVEAGDWRAAMSLRGWFAGAFPPDSLLEWVGESVERARLLASLAGSSEEDEFGGEISPSAPPDPVAVELIARFPGDEEIGSSFASDFMTGSWVGPWSSRLRQQLALLESWRGDSELPMPFRDWTRRLADSLERQLGDAIERESEERW